MAAIKVAVDVLLQSVASFREVSIYSDSRAAIPALELATMRSKLVKEYHTRNSLELLHNHTFGCLIIVASLVTENR